MPVPFSAKLGKGGGYRVTSPVPPASCSSRKQELHNTRYLFQKYSSNENWDQSDVTEEQKRDQMKFSEKA